MITWGGVSARSGGGGPPPTGPGVAGVARARLLGPPRPGEMTCGEIVRHLAGAERFFMTKVIDDRFIDELTPGAGLDHAGSRALLEQVHREEMARLVALDDGVLKSPRRDLDGGTIKAWRFLMAMVEHEVHHRSQLDCYLAEMGVEAPQIFDRRFEDVSAQVRAEAQAATGGRR